MKSTATATGPVAFLKCLYSYGVHLATVVKQRACEGYVRNGACLQLLIPCDFTFCDYHVILRCGPCHHGMERPWVADGGDGLQIWRIAASVVNKQSWTSDKWWFSSLGVGRGAPHRKRSLLRRGILDQVSDY
jgi:hypothetical protein